MGVGSDTNGRGTLRTQYHSLRRQAATLFATRQLRNLSLSSCNACASVDNNPRPASTSGMSLENLKFDANGLLPAIIQDDASGEVLMFAFMDQTALNATIETGLAHFYSRSRKKLWKKGESSGHVQHVKSIRTDCDSDVILVRVTQVGAACHEGFRTCFFRELDGGEWKTIGERRFDPKTVYGSNS
jgi:phosphoribosyl-AMP cyclohydrolase